MTSFDWQSFLKDWSRAILASPYAETYELSPSVIKEQWLGFAGAPKAHISAAEDRLGQQLPPSYRNFLKASNGWRNTGTFINHILPVEEIYWLRDSSDKSLLEHADLYLSQMKNVPYNPEYD